MTELKAGSFYGEPQRVSYVLKKVGRNRFGMLLARGELHSQVKEDGTGRHFTIPTSQISPIEEDSAQAVDGPVDTFIKGEWIRVWKLTDKGVIEVIAAVQQDEDGDLYIPEVGFLPEEVPAGVRTFGTGWTYQHVLPQTADTLEALMKVRGQAHGL